MEQLIYERIIQALTRLESKIDAVANDVAEIKEKVNDAEPEYSQWYNGGIR